MVYCAVDIESGDNVAVKTQRFCGLRSPLLAEYNIYETIKENKRSSHFIGIPKVFHYDEDDTSALMVMDRLGPNLAELFASQGHLFSRKTLLMLFKHMLVAIQNVHESGFIHRDIKPDNICMGRGENAGFVHLIDFGIAERYEDEETGDHVPMVNHGSFSGTVLFASVNALSGLTTSRRDDLESLIYVIMFLWTGKLPFADIDKDNIDMSIAKSRRDKRRDVAEVCQGYPQVVPDLLSYVRNLEYHETPDYVMMRGLIETDFDEFGFKEDGYFDWFYTRDGDEVVNNPDNLDNVYNTISLRMEKDSSSSEDIGSLFRAAVQSKIRKADSDQRVGSRKKKSGQVDPTVEADENSSSSNLKMMLSSCMGLFLRGVNSMKKNSPGTDSANLKSQKEFDDDDDVPGTNQEVTTKKKHLLRRFLKKLGGNKK